MDPRPALAGAESGTEPVLAEQAVFTSIRSPSGRGYRIVAASPGISPDEKREIVQRAPSHQSICDTSPHGCGLASFTMQSGRRCVFLSQNAGVEHSARGDYRVHTHVLLFDPHVYRSLHCDPLAIASAARAALGNAWLSDQPPPALTCLTLDVNAASVACSEFAGWSPAPAEVEGLLTVLSCLLCGRRVLVQGPPNLQRLLAWLWSGVPAGMRDALSLSCGLRFSPSRSFPLVLLEGRGSPGRRSGVDPDFVVVEWPSAAGPESSEFDRWLSFVRRRLAAGQVIELGRLSVELTDAARAPDLARVVQLHDDLMRLGEADLALVHALIERHAERTWTKGTGARLYGEFQRAAEMRRQALEEQQQAAAPLPDVGSGSCASRCLPNHRARR